MANQPNHSVSEQLVELLTNQGSGGLRQALETLLNATMAIEREQYLNAKSYERTNERRGYANGFKVKTLKTRIGTLELAVPQCQSHSVILQ